MDGNLPAPITLLGDLSKPATVLIEKISDAVGGMFKPFQIARVAKAEAEADLIRAESQIQITDLHRRAMHRFIEEEGTRQANIEEITAKALPQLEEKASPEKIEDDWITNFFDKSRIISDGDMQQLWSRVLAGEANAPGHFSKRTVNLLSDLDKRDAELFTSLCGFVWQIGDVVPLVFDIQAEIYNERNLNFNTLSHLEALGLVQFDNIAGFLRMRLPKRVTAYYYGKLVEITLPNDADNVLKVGRILLTNAGRELAFVCGARPVDGFFDFVVDRWRGESLSPAIVANGEV